MIRTSAFIFFYALSIFAVCAQDIIVRKNGETIEGKVTEVGVDKVTYKMDQSENSANFIILKRELSRIEFANGQNVWLNVRYGRERIKSGSKGEVEEITGRNILSMSPAKALDSGPGFGLSYEIQFGKNRYFAFILPVTMTIPGLSLDPFDYNSDNEITYYASPGFKIYPFGQRKVTYAVGPSVFFGHGSERYNFSEYDPVTGGYMTRSFRSTRFRSGVIINNYVAFQVTPKFQIGINAGLGPRFANRYTDRYQTTYLQGVELTGEFNFSLGIRF